MGRRDTRKEVDQKEVRVKKQRQCHVGRVVERDGQLGTAGPGKKRWVSLGLKHATGRQARRACETNAEGCDVRKNGSERGGGRRRKKSAKNSEHPKAVTDDLTGARRGTGDPKAHGVRQYVCSRDGGERGRSHTQLTNRQGEKCDEQENQEQPWNNGGVVAGARANSHTVEYMQEAGEGRCADR